MAVRQISLFLFISLFFLLSLSSAYAYQSFAQNPDFDSNINGLYLYANTSDPLTNNAWYTYNSTCFGATGCLFVLPTANSWNKIYLGSSETALDYHVTNETGMVPVDQYIVVPANKEGIVTISYYANATITNGNPLSSAPKLYVVQETPSYLVNVSQDLNTTANKWFNYTFIIPPSTVMREFVVYMEYGSAASTLLAVDRFRFWTWDLETQQSIVLDGTEDYCNYGTVTGGVSGTSQLSVSLPFAVGLHQDQTDKNSTGGTPLYCCVYQQGSLVIARRCVVDTSNVISNWISRDIYGFTGGGCNNGGYDEYFIVNQLLTNSVSYSSYMQGGGGQCYRHYIYYSTDGYFGWDANASLSLNLSAGTSGTFITLHNTSSLPTAWNLTGSQVYVKTSYISQSINYPLLYNNVYNTYFNGIVGLYCDVTGNQQYYVNGDGSRSDYRSCGSCGCIANNVKGYGCNAPNMTLPATQCDTDKQHWLNYIATSDNCSYTITSGVCPENSICINQPSDFSIICFNNITGTNDLCVNRTGGNTTCPATNLCQVNGVWTNCPSLLQNPGGALALGIGGLFGMTDLVASENITSLIISLLIGFAAVVVIAILSKRNVDSKGLGSIFMGTSMMGLVMFTLTKDQTSGTTWFPAWLTIVIIAAIAIIIGGVLSKQFGGG